MQLRLVLACAYNKKTWFATESEPGPCSSTPLNSYGKTQGTAAKESTVGRVPEANDKMVPYLM